MTSKRKTKQLRWLVTRLMLAMTMVMPASMWAQEPVMYTVYNNNTLTFKYGEKPESGFDVPTDPTEYKAPRWLMYKSLIKTVDFDDSFKDARPTSCYKWFESCSYLTSINNIENLNTANVKTMSKMFYGCSSLLSLDLSNFDTSNVTDMSFMFEQCSKLSYLDLSKFNTAKVTNMKSMFYSCSSLTSLDLSKFNTANVTDMIAMFRRCLCLTSLDLSSFNTANVTQMGYMFMDCRDLTKI